MSICDLLVKAKDKAVDTAKENKSLLVAGLLLVGSKMCDVEATNLLIQKHGSSMELNPLMRNVIDFYGIEGLRAIGYGWMGIFSVIGKEKKKTLYGISTLQISLGLSSVLAYYLV